jgi:hypothetical protein
MPNTVPLQSETRDGGRPEDAHRGDGAPVTQKNRPPFPIFKAGVNVGQCGLFCSGAHTHLHCELFCEACNAPRRFTGANIMPPVTRLVEWKLTQ